MRKNVVLFTFLLSTMPCFPQGIGTNAGCNLSGTWYGGSPDAPAPYYHGTITPISADRFSITFQLALEVQSAGYLRATDWTGELSRTGPHTYSGMAFSMWQIDPNSLTLFPPGVDPSLPELDFIHIKSMEVLDCNTLRFTYDLWALYGNFTNDINPMETPPPPPGLIFDPMIVEVYHRMPTSVPPAWLSAGASSVVAAPIYGKPGLKPPFKK